jgi:hypothetical protein
LTLIFLFQMADESLFRYFITRRFGSKQVEQSANA